MLSKVKPIKPSKVVSPKKKQSFPDAVLKSFNELIKEKYDGDSARIEQKDVVARIIKKGLKRKAIFDNDWLDVEEVYNSAGWIVVYDSPMYYEKWYEPSFTFERK
mgnify:FL=1